MGSLAIHSPSAYGTNHLIPEIDLNKNIQGETVGLKREWGYIWNEWLRQEQLEDSNLVLHKMDLPNYLSNAPGTLGQGPDVDLPHPRYLYLSQIPRRVYACAYNHNDSVAHSE